MSMSWREAIHRVLTEEGRAMHYSEISEQVLAKRYYKTEGATPDATVSAQITSSIKHQGENSPFLSLMATLEALLIEALEPPQNRKRGDDFSVMEYIQDVDPELKERELQNTLRTIEQKLRGQA